MGKHADEHGQDRLPTQIYGIYQFSTEKY